MGNEFTRFHRYSRQGTFNEFISRNVESKASHRVPYNRLSHVTAKKFFMLKGKHFVRCSAHEIWNFFALEMIPWFVSLYQLPQIHTLGDTICCCFNDWCNLDSGGFCFVRSHFTWPTSTQRAINLWDQKWKRVSNVCPRFNTNLCCGLKLHQLLRTMHRSSCNLLQVNHLRFGHKISISHLSFVCSDCIAMHRSTFDPFELSRGRGTMNHSNAIHHQLTKVDGMAVKRSLSSARLIK